MTEPTTRPTGEAAWKAHRDDLDRRNAAAKKSAHLHGSVRDLATVARERRMARAEELQLVELNKRIDGSRSA